MVYVPEEKNQTNKMLESSDLVRITLFSEHDFFCGLLSEDSFSKIFLSKNLHYSSVTVKQERSQHPRFPTKVPLLWQSYTKKDPMSSLRAVHFSLQSRSARTGVSVSSQLPLTVDGLLLTISDTQT